MNGSKVEVTLPCGTTLPPSPENRAYAQMKWEELEESKREREEKNEDEIVARAVRVQREEFEEMLRVERVERERVEVQLETERVGREQAERAERVERERAERQQHQLDAVNKELEHRRQIEILQTAHYEELRDERRKADEERIALRDTHGRHRTGEKTDADADDLSGTDAELLISHPAADVVVDFANAFGLEKRLRREQQDGTAQTGTITELYDRTMKKAPELKSIVQDRSAGSSLVHPMQRFRQAFHSKQKPGATTMMVSMMLAVQNLCPELIHRLITGLKVAASLTHVERLNIMESVKGTGEIGTLSNEQVQMTLTELPGMVELRTGGVSDEMMSSFEKLVMAHVQFDSDAAAKLRIAKQEYSDLNHNGYDDCEKLLFDENRAFENCTSWLGQDVLPVSERFENLVGKSTTGVRAAYVDFVSSPHSTESELSMMSKDWIEYRQIYQKLWCSATSRSKLEPQPIKTDSENRSRMHYSSVSQRQHNGSRAPLTDLPENQADMKCIDLKCVHCCGEFEFTVENQLYHQKMGYENEPKKCKRCKDKEKTCNVFEQTGECPFGDQCRFGHSSGEGDGTSAALPGTIGKPCRDFETGKCELQDKCPYRHEGRALQQQEQAEMMKRGKECDSFRGFPLKKSVGFNR